MKTTCEITLNEGDRLKVTEVYSSYGADEQEEVFYVTAKHIGQAIRLFRDDGNQFFKGINSSYIFEIPDDVSSAAGRTAQEGE